jgi:hypothetical protein
LEFEILEIFEDNYDEVKNKERISAFIMDKQKSISPKTKKKSKEMVKRLGIE